MRLMALKNWIHKAVFSGCRMVSLRAAKTYFFAFHLFPMAAWNKDWPQTHNQAAFLSRTGAEEGRWGYASGWRVKWLIYQVKWNFRMRSWVDGRSAQCQKIWWTTNQSLIKSSWVFLSYTTRRPLGRWTHCRKAGYRAACNQAARKRCTLFICTLMIPLMLI